ncbi:hypothetical protein D3C87_457140 [compost metagenome]
MKEDKEHIDDLFKESLEQRTFEIPDAFMADLNSRLDAVQSKKKRRFLFTLFVPTLIGIGISLAVLLFYSQNQVSQSIHPKQTADSSKSTIQSTEENNTGNDSESISGKQQTKAPEINSTDKKDPINRAESNNKLITEADQSANKPFKTDQKTGSETLRSKQSKTNSTKTLTVPKKNTGSQRTSHTKGKAKTGLKLKKTPSKGLKALTPKKPGEKTVPNPVTGKPLENSGESGEVAENEEKTTTGTNENQQAATGKDSTKLADSIAASSVATAENPVIEIPKTNSKNWGYEVQLYGGIGGNWIHDSKKNQSNSIEPKVSQSSILAPSFGINGNASFNKLTFGLGLSYMQTGEKFKLETYSYSVKDSTYSEIITDTTWVFDSITGWTPVLHDTTIYHTTQLSDSTFQNNTFKNQYSWFSIPISFGYRFELGNYELIPRIGAQLNIGLGKNNGRYPIQNTDQLATYPAVKFNISYLIQLEARRNFDKWHVFVNPYFKSMISPAISGELIRRRYSSWGIQFGIGFKL